MSETEHQKGSVLEEPSDDGSLSGIELEQLNDISDPFDPTKIDIHTKGVTVQSIVNRLINSEIDLTPDFQRKGGIWKLDQMSRLIESFLLKIPIPVFYIASNKDDDWLIVDGLQRLTTFKKYIVKEDFSLSGLETLHKFTNLKFSDLPNKMQRRILETELVCHIIRSGTPKNVTRIIFKRINTGGLPLSAQEIRHALYQGKSTFLLKKLSESNGFKTAIDNGIGNARMADRECVLRFLAFYLTNPECYQQKDMDGFLCDCMEKLNQSTEFEIERIEGCFITAMQRNYQVFGKFAFRKMYHLNQRRSPINKALFEVWSNELLRLNETEIDLIIRNKKLVIEQFIKLMNGILELDKIATQSKFSFEQSITQDTSDPKKVIFRFHAIRAILHNILKIAS